MKDVLVARNLKKVYGGRGTSYTALHGIDLTIKEGEYVAVMGPSGAGKTTLLNLIATIDSPTEGEILIGGNNVVKMSEAELSSFRRDKLGFIFQDYNLLDNLTVKENIVLPLALARADHNIIEKRIGEIASTLQIGDILEKYPYEISGGQKQRTAASRAVISQPELILADEPTGNLDSSSSKELLEYLTGLNKAYQATILMVTHDAFAASYCKRILFIKDGRIYTELNRGSSRKEFFQKIMDVLKSLGGDVNDLI
ncbi:MAG: ABC transporter ATP-binding protein [Halanaerobiales bacterium]